MSDELTAADIEEGLRLDAARTPGEWLHDERVRCAAIYQGIETIDCLDDVDRFIFFVERPHDDQSRADFDFIAHAANHYARALRQLQSQAAELARLRKWERESKGALAHDLGCWFDLGEALGIDRESLDGSAGIKELALERISRLRTAAEGLAKALGAIRADCTIKVSRYSSVSVKTYERDAAAALAAYDNACAAGGDA